MCICCLSSLRKHLLVRLVIFQRLEALLIVNVKRGTRGRWL